MRAHLDHQQKRPTRAHGDRAVLRTIPKDVRRAPFALRNDAITVDCRARTDVAQVPGPEPVTLRPTMSPVTSASSQYPRRTFTCKTEGVGDRTQDLRLKRPLLYR